MAYDSRIILAGQGPDVMGAIGQGNAAAAQTNALRTSNQLAELYRTQGAGIMAGDQGALNALAGIDPNAALGVQGTQLGMAATKQNMAFSAEEMAMKREDVKRQAAEYAAGLSAAERQAEAAKIETGIKAASTAQTPEQWDAIVQQFGVPDLVGQFGMKDALLTSYADVATILKGGDQAALGDRYKVVGGTLFDLGAEGGPQPVGEGSVPEETIFDSNGNPIVMRGGQGSTKKFTEGQSKDNVYATRAEGALAKLDPVAGALTGIGDRMLDADPTGLVRGAFQGEEYQIAKQAGDEFLQAILRKDTGAAITEGEQALYGKTYLPQPGDGPAVQEQKRISRIRAIAAIKSGMTVDQIEAIALADAAVLQQVQATGQAPAQGAQPSQGGTAQPIVIDGYTIEPVN